MNAEELKQRLLNNIAAEETKQRLLKAAQPLIDCMKEHDVESVLLQIPPDDGSMDVIMSETKYVKNRKVVDFLAAIAEVCKTHSMAITVSGYDSLQVWPLDGTDLERIRDAADRTNPDYVSLSDELRMKSIRASKE